MLGNAILNLLSSYSTESWHFIHGPWIWILSVPSCCVLWRLWSFVLYPRLYPNEVAEVPYWIPFLGHTLSMFKDTAALIHYGIEYFNNSYEPFSIRVLGERLYIVTSPADVAAVYKRSAEFSWDSYMDRLLHCFGLSSESRQLAWNKPLPGGPNDAIMKVMNPQYKSLVHHIEDIYKLQLLPGERLDVILDTVLSQLDAALTWPRLSGPYVLSSTTDCRRVSIKTLCSFLVTNATTRSLFTDLIFEYEPKLIDHMAVFNDYSWACVFNVPRAFTPKLNKAKDTLSQAVRQFVRSTREKRSGASWSINAIIDAMQCFGMDEDSQVAMLFMIWWAAHSNTINATFWMMCHVVYNDQLVSALRAETAPAFKGDRMNIQYLMEKCPTLDSTYLEVLRLVNGAFSIRTVLQDTMVSGRVLKAGNSVIIPYRELHYNPNIWGSTTNSFDPDRFARHPKLAGHASYRPFGGGVSYCPGRHLAKAEVCGFVAAFINRFDFVVAPMADGEPQPFPRLDNTKPATGISSCMPHMDLLVNVTPRK